MKKVSIEIAKGRHLYDVRVGSGLLSECGRWAGACLPHGPGRIALVSNPTVFGLYGQEVLESLAGEGFEVFVRLMPEGEEHKNLDTLRDVLRFFGEKRLGRTDAVVALGGGVVGDLAGFAAAVYLRGIAFLQIPTTLLAMIDSSVGGKTAVNTEFGKNLVGAFHQPAGVLVDVGTLRTLDRRELVAGFCEAVKQGAVGSRELFEETDGFLEKYPPATFGERFDERDFLGSLGDLLVAQISFKAGIVTADEREETGRSDSKSRKILNFGHTTAHALEKITGYARFRHGEAVGYGMLAAGAISKKLDICPPESIKLLNDVVRKVGVLPAADDIRIDDLLGLFSYDKKSIGGSLQWVLIEDIGRPRIVDGRDIPQTIIRESLREALQG